MSVINDETANQNDIAVTLKAAEGRDSESKSHCGYT